MVESVKASALVSRRSRVGILPEDSNDCFHGRLLESTDCFFQNLTSRRAKESQFTCRFALPNQQTVTSFLVFSGWRSGGGVHNQFLLLPRRYWKSGRLNLRWAVNLKWGFLALNRRRLLIRGSWKALSIRCWLKWTAGKSKKSPVRIGSLLRRKVHLWTPPYHLDLVKR